MRRFVSSTVRLRDRAKTESNVFNILHTAIIGSLNLYDLRTKLEGVRD